MLCGSACPPLRPCPSGPPSHRLLIPWHSNPSSRRGSHPSLRLGADSTSCATQTHEKVHPHHQLAKKPSIFGQHLGEQHPHIPHPPRHIVWCDLTLCQISLADRCMRVCVRVCAHTVKQGEVTPGIPALEYYIIFVVLGFLSKPDFGFQLRDCGTWLWMRLLGNGSRFFVSVAHRDVVPSLRPSADLYAWRQSRAIPINNHQRTLTKKTSWMSVSVLPISTIKPGSPTCWRTSSPSTTLSSTM